MNKLTKLMLASAMMITSGFATEATVSILSGSNPINEGGIETIANKDVVLTGSMTLATSDTAANVAQLVINEGRTFEVRSGTLSKSGTGSENAKITLKGTLKITEAEPGEGKTHVAPNVDLSNVAIEGGSSVTYLCFDWDIEDYVEMTDIIIDGTDALSDGDLCYGTSDGVDIVLWNGNCYRKTGGHFTVSGNSFVNLSGSSKWAMLSGDSNFVFDMTEVADNKVPTYEICEKKESSTGCVDLSALQLFSGTNCVLKDYSSSIKNISPTSLAEVKLPFNCKFSGLDLKKVGKVSYDVLKIGEQSDVGIVGDVIKKVITTAEGTYGDYKNMKDLGVVTTFEGTENLVAGNKKDINLSDIVDRKDLNIAGMKLLTDDLDASSMEIASDTTFKFGLKGSTEITVTSAAVGKKLILAGDNSAYEPTNVSNVTMPDVVEFAESNSLLPFTFEYEKGIFSGSSKTNSIASGISVEFTNGVELAAGNTLEVSGSLTL